MEQSYNIWETQIITVMGKTLLQENKDIES
jgi:hypothetical protein